MTSRAAAKDRALHALLARAIAAHAGRAVRTSDYEAAARMLTMRGAPLEHVSMTELIGVNGAAVVDPECLIG